MWRHLNIPHHRPYHSTIARPLRACKYLMLILGLPSLLVRVLLLSYHPYQMLRCGVETNRCPQLLGHHQLEPLGIA
jgi:hypothetical protein